MLASNFKTVKPNKKTIFIVEGDEINSLSFKEYFACFLNTIKIRTFYFGKTCLIELHRNPIVILADYLLISKYQETDYGLEIIKRIKILKPETNTIVLCVEKNFKVDLESIKGFDCVYIQKDQKAFKKTKRLIRKIFSLKHTPAVEPWD